MISSAKIVFEIWHSVSRALFLIFIPGLVTVAAANETAFANFLAQGEQAEERKDVVGTLDFYLAADQLQSTNCADLCLLTKSFCDLMHDTSSPELQKTLAEHALATALRAVQANPKSATAHLCVAVAYAKNFPYADIATTVKWSRAIKLACETAIALDPKQDVATTFWAVGTLVLPT